MNYQPPFTITPKIVNLVSSICERMALIDARFLDNSPQLRKQNRIKTITDTLAIEGNTLNLQQVTAIVEGKRILGPQKEIAEVHGAIKAYEALPLWDYSKLDDLFTAHQFLMAEILTDAGHFRGKAVGIRKGNEVVHIAPQAARVPILMAELLEWSKKSEHHALIVSSVFHYELEFIHPFSDGNGRMGRLWQTLILGKWNELFYFLPLESVIKNKQQLYYEALSKSDTEANSSVFVEFILEAIQDVLTSTDQVSDQVSDQVKKLLAILDNNWLSSREMMGQLKLTHKPTFRKNYLNPALEKGLIIMSEPDRPRSPRQKYKRI